MEFSSYLKYQFIIQMNTHSSQSEIFCISLNTHSLLQYFLETFQFVGGLENYSIDSSSTNSHSKNLTGLSSLNSVLTVPSDFCKVTEIFPRLNTLQSCFAESNVYFYSDSIVTILHQLGRMYKVRVSSSVS